ncbi:class I SAM-dependent methyltransferase [Seonamhaeicola sp.]|uniref:class I SAM-dependent methyltransferase n=1 Tax=Seonamhaeicola sp. TaxID=1912245 RepID=UPI00260E0E1E|nr:class I SAM-dependent methyltransferase [Seonamhaeicola sp.]
MDFQEIKKYYKDKFESFGHTAQGMDWKDKASQYLRFEIISKYMDFNSSPTILDVGCGSSEFLNFCLINKLQCNYKGLDITEEMVASSNNRFGPNTAVLGDLFTFQSNEQFDYVIASGTFNAKLNSDNENWKLFFYDNLLKMFEKSKKGIVFNCMSEHVDWTYDRLYYPNISNLTAFIVEKLSRKFVIDHSYDLYEMTVYISK